VHRAAGAGQPRDPLTEDHRHQADLDRVQQPGIQAAAGDRSAGDADILIADQLARLRDRGLDRGLEKDRHAAVRPVLRRVMGDHDHRHLAGGVTAPAASEVVKPAATTVAPALATEAVSRSAVVCETCSSENPSLSFTATSPLP
jgi:hypothetical protein